MVGRMNGVALLGVAVAIAALMVPEVARAQSNCSDGTPGVQSASYDICCSLECTTCGGEACALQNTTNGAFDCCVTEITESGIYCSESGEAPCILSATVASNSTCDNGLSGIQDASSDVCCSLECGDACGGAGCGSIPGTEASDCCTDEIMATGRDCAVVMEAPCFDTANVTDADLNTTCSNGLVGYEDPEVGVCCDAACGLCGGVGCGSVTGLSSDDCCSSTILANGTSCDITGAAPCIMEDPEYAASMCPNGIPGVQDGTVCCAEECNLQCGGAGCGSIRGTNGASDCCSATILASGVLCEQGVSAPCIMVNGTYTNAPTAAPSLITAAPTMAERAGEFSMAPTAAGVSVAPTATPTSSSATALPTASGRGIETAAPAAQNGTSAPPAANSTAPTPSGTATPPDTDTTPSPMSTSGAGSLSSSSVITLVAIAGGAFAIRAAARN